MVSSPFVPNAQWRDDARTIGLIGMAHGVSHFFQMLLPPLFPLFIRDFGLSWSQLGLLMTVFFVVSGMGQALAGFVVDRVGARPVLFGALSFFVAAALAATAAQGYGGLMLAAVLAGIGNAPFHPINFTILNHRVSQARLGHAFSVHGVSGNLGWAAAPVFMAGVAALSGSWRMACLGAAALAVVTLTVVIWQRDALTDRSESGRATDHAAAGSGEHPLAFLKRASVWLCFAFFFCSTASLAGIQGFASPALQRLYALPLAATAFIVTGYMLCAAVGIVVGGFLVGRVHRLERLIAIVMTTSAAVLLLAGSGWVPGGLAAALVVGAGLGTGMAGPSRDMLIRHAAPPGATGRVYGLVYSGLDAGFAMAAPIFGALLDHGHPSGVFLGAALALLTAVASAAMVGVRVAARAHGLPAAA